VRRKPYTVLLFDEIEKASTDVLNILLQILDEGKLKDSKGRWIDFKSTIIVMTSNLGSEEFSKKKASIGFNANTNDGKEIDENQFTTIRSRILEELKDFMSPELINRIDYKIVFKPLSKEIVRNIFEKNLKEFLDVWMLNKEITVPSFTKTKIKEIVDEIYDPQYGARPIQRYIHDKIENEIIEQIMK
jgi:ATP-dependent Clp protease ATP-binding subunit ClpC